MRRRRCSRTQCDAGGADYVKTRSSCLRVVATNRKTILETVPDTGENSQCSSSQQDVPHRDTDNDWQDRRSAYLCVGGQRAQSVRRSSVCSPSIDTTMDVGILLVCSGSCQELCLTPMQHVLNLTMGVQLSKLAMSMHEDACRWQCWSVTITCMVISSRRWAESRLRGRVRAWTEACRV